MGRPSFCRTKYLLSFLVALVAAFMTFNTFDIFRGTAVFSDSMLFLNAAVLLAIWFISFTSDSEFVRRNLVLLIILPAFGLYASNFSIALTTSGTSIAGFFLYIGTSTLLIASSYKARQYEQKL